MHQSDNENHFPVLDRAISIYLLDNKMTQAQLAEKLGMTENTFRWKRQGVREYKTSELLALTDLLGMSLDEAVDRVAPVGNDIGQVG